MITAKEARRASVDPLKLKDIEARIRLEMAEGVSTNCNFSKRELNDPTIALLLTNGFRVFEGLTVYIVGWGYEEDDGRFVPYVEPEPEVVHPRFSFKAAWKKISSRRSSL